MDSSKFSLPYFFLPTLLLIFFSQLFSNSRVAFSRPGSLIRNPALLTEPIEQEYFIGFSNEIINLSTLNSSNAIFFNSLTETGLQYGAAYSTHAKTMKGDNPPTDLSFHVGKKIYESNKIKINMGINDILYSTNGKHELSLYISLFNSGIAIGKANRYALQSAIGFGTGKINHDSHNYSEDISHKARFFFGLNFKTPYLSEKGGMHFLVDFDGSGTHLGATIPINKKIEVKAAITNFQNISDLSKYKDKTQETIFSNATALSIGVGFKLSKNSQPVPRVKNYKAKFLSSPEDCIVTHTRKDTGAPLSLDGQCEDFTLNEFIINVNQDFGNLKDSITMISEINANHNHAHIAKDYEIKTLQDSINMQYLKQRISKSELNIAMKHISQSLQYYYIEEYLLALEEIEHAIKRFPGLAIAYARKGSIYYQMGDLTQATINWNLALKHDPEYAEVREMLLSIKTEIDKISSNNN